MEQIIPDNENIEDYFDEDEVKVGVLGLEQNTTKTGKFLESG